MNHTHGHNILSFRPGEEWELRRERPNETRQFERVYVVSLENTPEFPFADEQGIHEECRRQVVIAAEVYPTVKSGMKPRIGWVTLDPHAKAAIGMDLEQEGAEPGQWFYMVLDTRKYRNQQ